MIWRSPLFQETSILCIISLLDCPSSPKKKYAKLGLAGRSRVCDLQSTRQLCPRLERFGRQQVSGDSTEDPNYPVVRRELRSYLEFPNHLLANEIQSNPMTYRLNPMKYPLKSYERPSSFIKHGNGK